jgi:hypothetical protein
MYAAIGLTLAEMVNIYCGLPARPAPGAVAPDRNDVPVYLHAVTSGMGMGANTLVSEALKVAA